MSNIYDQVVPIFWLLSDMPYSDFIVLIVLCWQEFIIPQSLRYFTYKCLGDDLDF